MEIQLTKKSYYHLLQNEGGEFSHDDTIATMDADTTEGQRIEMANAFTNGQFSKYPGFYEICGPWEQPTHITIK
jgi:hypothetical protein